MPLRTKHDITGMWIRQGLKLRPPLKTTQLYNLTKQNFVKYNETGNGVNLSYSIRHEN